MPMPGLIFATDDADDRPGMLAATLPFGGLTLIEFQARLLIAAGASQIILVVARMTPELLGAINRIGRRGVSADAVRTASEAVEKLHPLSRVLVVADGLMTTNEVMTSLLGAGGDALLVTDDRENVSRSERVGALTAWAGLALLDPKRIAEVAAMPRIMISSPPCCASPRRRAPNRCGYRLARRATPTRSNAICAAWPTRAKRSLPRWFQYRFPGPIDS